MKRLISAFIAGLLMITLVITVPVEEANAEAKVKPVWNEEYYGDRLDIDGHLSYLDKDEAFLNRAEEKIKGQADLISDETITAQEDAADSNFTYDGGTKYFLNRDLDFKAFTLRSEGTNVEVWVADELAFPEGDPRPVPQINQEQVDKLRDEFDSNIYPTATAFFGDPDMHDGSQSLLTEWGLFPEGYYEGSEKVIILVDNIIDENYYMPEYPFFVAGFFWQTLEMYIDRNMITIDTNTWEERLESTFYPTTIHELQHLIHSDHDPHEESWINEGMSTFSEFLGGYGLDAGSVNFYLDHPENSLVKWDDHYSAPTGPETIADYGQVYLFTMYMNDKLGQDFIRELAVSPLQGINSINNVLSRHQANLDFTKIYQNFITALVIDSDNPGNGVYNFDSINLREIPINKEGTIRGKTVDFESALTYEKEGVPAWGGDFKVLDFQQKIHGITFDGVDFLPIPWITVGDPLGSDNQVLWGNEGDEADNMLIFEADLTGVSTATLSFDNLLDIEEQWDFGFVQVSTDGGYNWTSLANENTRSDLVEEGYPKIRENLPGFTGYYDNWQKESFDLSSYAGQKVLISFRYITDWGYNDLGWFVDNIEIPEIGLIFDGSSTEGFVSLSSILGQYVNYTVTFINETEVGNKKGRKTQFRVITVDPFDVTQEDALQIRNLFQKGKNYMITTFAAPPGERDSVSFTYEVIIKGNQHKNNGNRDHDNKRDQWRNNWRNNKNNNNKNNGRNSRR
ncbi:immune inhibitor A [Mobilitalea sibirica]|uniref:Immune inhibitor A n=1 Tax=Mobilitalea sibirica TaxID=1462919 RepID=A0A8J7KWT1_9FIRM|nr:immune inhibitor A domain-containing protein [Mobilitalea sibirica]MBH1941725.1 immune inhibitor A [Mobilitalea sibirica]